jgi:hypothetical protein
MEKKKFNIIMIGMALLFMMSMFNTCSSCSSSRKADGIIAAQAKSDSINMNQTKQFELQIQMMQPQIVNQILMLFNAKKYSSEIELNNAKINALNQQIQIITAKNDTTKKNR